MFILDVFGKEGAWAIHTYHLQQNGWKSNKNLEAMIRVTKAWLLR
jgi:hypothetical protein